MVDAPWFPGMFHVERYWLVFTRICSTWNIGFGYICFG